jgi:hypothetical protein
MRTSRAALAKLCAQLRRGDVVAAGMAARTLRSLTADGGPRCDCIVSVGGTEALLAALSLPEAAVATNAAVALHSLLTDGDEGYPVRCASVVESGGVAVLVAALRREEGQLAAHAAGALACLTAGADDGCADRCEAIRSARGIVTLVAATRREEATVAAGAACVLRNLCAGTDEGAAGRRVALGERGVAALVEALGRREALVAQAAVDALTNVCAGVEAGAWSASRDAVAAHACSLLAAAQRREKAIATQVLRLIDVLVGKPSIAAEFIAADGTAAMVRAARRREADVVASAVSVLSKFARGSDSSDGARRDGIVVAGGLAALVAALLRPEAYVAAKAAGCLSALTSDDHGGASCDARRAAAKAAGAVAPLLRLVKLQAAAAASAASALYNLCCGDDVDGYVARQQAIVKQGGLPILVAAVRRPDIAAGVASTLICTLRELFAGDTAACDAAVAAGAASALADLALRIEHDVASAAADALFYLVIGEDANAGVRRDAAVLAGAGLARCGCWPRAAMRTPASGETQLWRRALLQSSPWTWPATTARSSTRR